MQEPLTDERAKFGTAEAVLKQKAEAKVKDKPSELIRLTIKQWCDEIERAKRAHEDGKTELVETCLRLAELYQKTLSLYVYKDMKSAKASKMALDYMDEKYGKRWGTV